MISGETRGGGGPALARHLESVKDGQRVHRIAPRHLAATSLSGQLREIVLGAKRNRTARPILHVHIDPPAGHQSAETFRTWVEEFEREFGLEDAPRAGVFHIGKGGNDRRHAHVCYGLVRLDGRLVDLKNSYRRREKVSVVVAARLGLPPPPIPRSRSVLKSLIKEGREDTVHWMRANYPDLAGGPRVAATSPLERQIAERTGLSRDAMLATIAKAWPAPSAYEFRKRLAASYLGLAIGDQVPVVVDRAGTPHPLARTIRSACKAYGIPPPRASEVHALVAGLPLPSVAHLNRNQTMAQESKSKIKTVTGQDIVNSFGTRVRLVRKGPPHRILLRDGGWVVVDSSTRTLRVSGKPGDADTLAAELATLEDYRINRIERRRLRRTPAWSLSAPNSDEVQDNEGRFQWWASRGHTPEMRAGGVAIEIDGTLLVDRGARIEVHNLPPSDKALDEIARYAAENWNGALILTGPPGAIDWSDDDKGRLWMACQRYGVTYRGYSPSPALLRQWEREEDKRGGAAAAALRPGPAVHPESPLPARPPANTREIDELDAEINKIKGEWRHHGRDPDRIGAMRVEVERLEEQKARLIANVKAEPPPPQTPRM